MEDYPQYMLLVLTVHPVSWESLIITVVSASMVSCNLIYHAKKHLWKYRTFMLSQFTNLLLSIRARVNEISYENLGLLFSFIGILLSEVVSFSFILAIISLFLYFFCSHSIAFSFFFLVSQEIVLIETLIVSPFLYFSGNFIIPVVDGTCPH